MALLPRRVTSVAIMMATRTITVQTIFGGAPVPRMRVIVFSMEQQIVEKGTECLNSRIQIFARLGCWVKQRLGIK